MEVTKCDWKMFRTRIGDWQEAYMERLVKEYMIYDIAALINGGSARRIKENRSHDSRECKRVTCSRG